MINKSILGNFSIILLTLKNNIRKIYQSSNFYDKKISRVDNVNFGYKPSPYLLSSIVKSKNKKYRIEDFTL